MSATLKHKISNTLSSWVNFVLEGYTSLIGYFPFLDRDVADAVLLVDELYANYFSGLVKAKHVNLKQLSGIKKGKLEQNPTWIYKHTAQIAKLSRINQRLLLVMQNEFVYDCLPKGCRRKLNSLFKQVQIGLQQHQCLKEYAENMKQAQGKCSKVFVENKTGVDQQKDEARALSIALQRKLTEQSRRLARIAA